MGAVESAPASDNVQLPSRGRKVTCIAEAAAKQQRMLHIPLFCGASTAVDLSTVLGEGSYGVVYGGSVDRSTCRHCISAGSTQGSSGISEDDAADSRQSSVCPRQDCQYCFSDRTHQVAVKALRHSSERQQRLFLNRLKFLQLVRLQQLLMATHETDGRAEQHRPVDMLLARSVSDIVEQEHAAADDAHEDKHSRRLQGAEFIATSAWKQAFPADVSFPANAEENSSCRCCKFLHFPSFDSLHLLQVFGVYACSEVSKEFLVMEKLSGPTLVSHLCNKYSQVLPKEWEACQIIVPILRGLRCIHQEGVSTVCRV